jgi:hypothetical protein
MFKIVGEIFSIFGAAKTFAQAFVFSVQHPLDMSGAHEDI